MSHTGEVPGLGRGGRGRGQAVERGVRQREVLVDNCTGRLCPTKFKAFFVVFCGSGRA